MENKDGEISIVEASQKVRQLFFYVLARWKIVVAAGLIGAVLGLVYATQHKAVYTAECTFVLEGESNDGLSSYAGIASMVGINLPSGGGGLFRGENIIDLYRSREMILKTLLSFGQFDGRKMLLIERYILNGDLRDSWTTGPAFRKLSFRVPRESFTRAQDSILKVIVGNINSNDLTIEKPNIKSSIISVRFKSEDELFAKEFTVRLVENVNQFYIETRTKKAIENQVILQRQTDSVRNALNAALYGVASSSDINPNPNPALRVLQVASKRREVDVQANQAILSELVKNLEVAKVSLRRETPLLQIVDRPVLPLTKVKIGKFQGALIGGGLGCLGIVMCIILGTVFRRVFLSNHQLAST